MYEREVDGRRKVAITDIEALVPENHLVRKIEKVMDYEWIYEMCIRDSITGAGLKESHPHDIQITKEAPNYSYSL